MIHSVHIEQRDNLVAFAHLALSPLCLLRLDAAEKACEDSRKGKMGRLA